MEINAKSLALSGGVIWGMALFLITLLSLATGYASMFLGLIADIYPGYSISILGSFIGLIYGFVDAYLGFYILAWLYNKYLD